MAISANHLSSEERREDRQAAGSHAEQSRETEE